MNDNKEMRLVAIDTIKWARKKGVPENRVSNNAAEDMHMTNLNLRNVGMIPAISTKNNR